MCFVKLVVLFTVLLNENGSERHQISKKNK